MGPVREKFRDTRGGHGTLRRSSAPPPPTARRHRSRASLRSKHEDEREDAPPRRRRRRRNGASGDEDFRSTMDGDGTDVAARALESSVAFLSRPISLPFFADLSVPLAYPLATLAGFAILPLSTWGLSVLLSGTYLALGTAVSGDRESSEMFDGSDQRRGEDEASEDDETGGALLPWASFAGGLATAGLLSPQGLVAGGDAWSLAAPAGIAVAGFGLVTLAAGIDELGAEEEIWEDKQREEGVAREERTRMERWDEELDNRFER